MGATCNRAFLKGLSLLRDTDALRVSLLRSSVQAVAALLVRPPTAPTPPAPPRTPALRPSPPRSPALRSSCNRPRGPGPWSSDSRRRRSSWPDKGRAACRLPRCISRPPEMRISLRRVGEAEHRQHLQAIARIQSLRPGQRRAVDRIEEVDRNRFDVQFAQGKGHSHHVGVLLRPCR